MHKLLRANFARLIKSATFWTFFCAYTLYSILTPLVARLTYSSPFNTSMAILSLGYDIIGIPIPAITVAFICTVIFGSDFINRTLKNQIIVGHKKSQIYVASWLTTSIISIALLLVYLFFFCIITLPMFGAISEPTKDVFMLTLNGTLMTLAYSAIFTFITMTSKNPISALIISLVLIVASFLVALFVYDFVSKIPLYIYVDAEFFGIPYQKKVPNPDYPSDAVMGLYNFMMDFFPAGQSVRLYLDDFRWQPALYSLGWIGATSGAGILIFNKTSLK